MKNQDKVLQQIKSYAGEYDIVPIRKEIFADVITPIGLLRNVAAKNKRFYLLESVEGRRKMGALFFPWIRPGHAGILL